MIVILSWNVRGTISSTMSLSRLLDQTLCDLAIISKLNDNTTCINYVGVAGAFLRVFLNVINSRISEFVIDNSFICRQQQKHLGYLIASFYMQETICYNVKQGSNIY